MPPKNQGTTVQAMFEARLRWALESSLTHFLHRPNRNTIEDWAAAVARDICGDDLTVYIRPHENQTPLPSAESLAPFNGSAVKRLT